MSTDREYNIHELRKMFSLADVLVKEIWREIYDAKNALEEQKKMLPQVRDFPYYVLGLKAFEILDEVKDEVDVPQMVSDSLDKLMGYNN
jgi:hypothetical protein